MSARPIEQKQRRKVARAIRRGRLTRHIDLIRYLKDRRIASTTGEAKEIILAKRVIADSHVLGVDTVKMLGPTGEVEDTDIVNPIVPASVLKSIVVKDPVTS